jgi:hypothetical protein
MNATAPVATGTPSSLREHALLAWRALNAAAEVLATIDPESTDEGQRMQALQQQVQAAALGLFADLWPGHFPDLGEPMGLDCKEPTDAEKALAFYRACYLKQAPDWVPDRIRLPSEVRGDFPIGHHAVAAAEEHPVAYCNKWGAFSIRAQSGELLGIKPGEYEVVVWRRAEGAPV